MLQNLKFCSLQNLSSVNLPTVIPTELQHTFMQMKHERIAVPDTTTDTSASFKYEENLLCLPNKLCVMKQIFQFPIPPCKEKYLKEEKRDILAEMYIAIYSQENVAHVPLHYEEFRDLKVFEKTYFNEINVNKVTHNNSSMAGNWRRYSHRNYSAFSCP